MARNSVMPIPWRPRKYLARLSAAVPDFGVEIVEMIRGEESYITVQALLGGTMPADVPGLVKKGEVGRIAHAYIIRYNADGKISRLDCYWDTPRSTRLRRAPCSMFRRAPNE